MDYWNIDFTPNMRQMLADEIRRYSLAWVLSEMLAAPQLGQHPDLQMTPYWVRVH